MTAQNLVPARSSPGTLPLSRHQVFSTTDPELAREYLAQALLPQQVHQRVTLQLNPDSTAFECTHNAIELRNMTVNAISYGASVTLDLRDVETHLFLVLVLCGTCRIQSGNERFVARVNDMFVVNARQAVTAQLSADFHELVIRLDESVVSPALLGLIDRAVSVPLHFTACRLPPNGACASLSRYLRLLCSEMNAEGSALRSTLIRELYEQTLLSLILTSIPHNYSEWLHRGPSAIAPIYVRRAERFIQENLRSPLTLEDIVAKSGACMRSLHKGFRQYRRTTPLLFLKECRLQYVRTQLQREDMRRRSIADVAHEAGFLHPSKFSQAYRDRFNELPSDTRRRTT